MIGRSDLLDMRKGLDHWKAKGLDFSRVFYQPPMPAEVARHQCESQDHRLDRALDHQIIAAAAPALDKRQPVRLSYKIRNAHRSVGAMLSGEIARRNGHEGLPEDTIHLAFEGVAGQSFGAFLARGVTFELQGRDQRLRRQGAVRRPHRRLPRSGVSREGGGEHRHREHGDVRRDRW